MSLWLSAVFLFIYTGSHKCDQYKDVQSTNIVWNVLLLCLRLSHGMVATERMCGRKFLRQWRWHSLVKLCTKHEKLWKSVNICNSYGKKKSVHLFMWTACTLLYWKASLNHQTIAMNHFSQNRLDYFGSLPDHDQPQQRSSNKNPTGSN